MRHVITGLVFLVAIVLFGTAILLVGDFVGLFASPVHLYVGFDQVEGLRKGDDIRVEGVLRGKVRQIILREEGVLVVGQLEEPVKLYKGYRIAVVPSNALGGNQISIRRGVLKRGEADPWKYGNIKTLQEVSFEKDDPDIVPVYRGSVTPGAFEALGELASEAKDPLMDTVEKIGKAAEEAEKALGKASEVMDEAKKTIKTINEGEGTIGKLLTDDQIYNDIKDITGKINRGEGTIGRLVSTDDLYHDIKAIMGDVKEVTETAKGIVQDVKGITGDLRDGKGILGRLLYDEVLAKDIEDTIRNIKSTSADLYDIIHGVKMGEGTIGKLFQEDDLYEDAQKALSGLNNTIGRAGNARTILGGASNWFPDTGHSISRIFVRFEPDDQKYFQVGAALISLAADETTIKFEDQVKENDDQTFIEFEIYIAYKLPELKWFLDDKITFKGGLLEGKAGGAVDIWWEDWGIFEHRIDFTFEIRDAYNDFDDEDIDENLRGPMIRFYAKTAIFPEMDGWFAGILHSTKAYVGWSRVGDSPEFFFGIGFEYDEKDVRTLLGLVGTGT